MKKTLLIFNLLLSFCLITKAQFKEIAAGPEFAEPHSEYVKLLLTKKGTLVLAQVGPKDSIHIRIYNTAHQETAVASYEMTVLTTTKKEYLALTEAFEINGDVVLFISTTEEKKKVLYRVIVDQNSGQVKKEEKIFELKPETKKDAYALSRISYQVNKAVDGDNYTIAFCNNLASEKIKKLEVVLFNKEHTEISRSSYETAEKEFGFLDLYGVKVFDAEKVAVLFVGHSWKVGGYSKIFLGLMNKGVSAISATVLDFPEEPGYSPAIAQMDYDQFSNKIIVATEHGKYLDEGQYICFLNPQTGKTEKIMKFKFSDVIYKKDRELYGKRHYFSAKPVKLLPGKNGGFSVMYEQDESMTSNGPGAKVGEYNFTTYTYSFTLDIIVADFDKNGTLITDYLIPKRYLVNPTPNFGNQYRTLAYINSNNRGYVFMNDTRTNIERLQENKAPKQVSTVNDCDAFYFPLTGNEPIPPRKYLFRETGEKEEHIQSPFGVFVYDKENDLLITLRLNRYPEARKKTSNVVWLKPQ